VSFDTGSRSRLTPQMAARFTGETLFDRVARTICHASCLPRKELYEAWEVARRTRRKFRGGRVWDLAAGHGLLAHLMILLDDTSEIAFAVDPDLPASAGKITEAMAREWPRLAGRVQYLRAPISDARVAAADLVVSAHACGALSDEVLAKAMGVTARVALLPCCHDKKTCDAGGVEGWMDIALAVDVTRAARLRASGYKVMTQTIPAEITPKNRLLLAEPFRTAAR